MFDGIGKMISQLFFDIVIGLLKFLYFIEDSFYILAGSKPLHAGESGDSQTNLLYSLVSDKDVQLTFGFFIAFGVGILVISTGIAIYKANIEENSKLDWKRTIRRSLQAIGILIFMPIIFLTFINIVCQLMEATVEAISGTLGHTSQSNSYIAQALFQSYFKNTDITSEKWFNINTTSYSMLNDHGIIMDAFKGDCNFDYLSGVVVTCVVLWSMFVATLGLIERLINIILLYIIGPVAAGTSPIDDGERYKAWKTYVLSKGISVFGNIISIFVYIFILGKFQYLSSQDFGSKVLFYIIAIGGAFTASKGSNIIASIISRDAGNQDGWSQGQTNALLQGGMGLAKGVLGGGMATAGAMMFGKGNGSTGIAGGLTQGLSSAARSVAAGGNATSVGGAMKKGLGAIKNTASNVGNAMSNSFRFGGLGQAAAAGVGALAGSLAGGIARTTGKGLRKLGGLAGGKISTTRLGVGMNKLNAKIGSTIDSFKTKGKNKKASNYAVAVAKHNGALKNKSMSLISEIKGMNGNKEAMVKKLQDSGYRGKAFEKAKANINSGNMKALEKTIKKNSKQMVSGYKTNEELGNQRKKDFGNSYYTKLRNDVLNPYKKKEEKPKKEMPKPSTKSLNETVNDANKPKEEPKDNGSNS